MSGIEVVGIVLAVMPLIITALEDYKAGANKAAAFMQYRGMLDNLLHKLKTQQSIFSLIARVLLRAAGVDESSFGSDLDCASTLRASDVRCEIETYLGAQYGAFEELVHEHEKCLKLIAGTIVNIRRLPKASADDLQALVEANPPLGGSFDFRQRIKFVMNRTKLKNLVTDLNERNDSLSRLIQWRAMFDTILAPPSVEAHDFATHLEEVQRIARSLCSAISAGWVPGCHDSHNALLQIKDRVRSSRPRRGKTVRRNPMDFEMFFDTNDNCWCPTLISWSGDPDPCHATVTGTPGLQLPTLVVIHDDGQVAGPASLENRHIVNMCLAIQEARGKDHPLALALNTNMLYHSKQNLEGGLDHPCHERCSTTTLERVLLNIFDGAPQMGFRQRSYLGFVLSSSVLQLHGTPWLDQPWNKGSIRFFATPVQRCPGPNTDLPMIAQRFSSEGNHSAQRLDETGVKQALLELSILLLEIWHQSPIEIWAEKNGFSNVSSFDERKIVAEKWYYMTSHLMIPPFADAIETCLQICVGRRRRWDETDFIKSVYENVVKPLMNNYESWART